MKIYALLSTAYSSGFHSISFTLCWIIVQESGEIAQRTVKEPFAPASKFSIDRFFLSGVNLDIVLSKQVTVSWVRRCSLYKFDTEVMAPQMERLKIE